MIFQEQYKAKIDALQTKLFEERISNYDEYLAAAAIIFSEPMLNHFKNDILLHKLFYIDEFSNSEYKTIPCCENIYSEIDDSYLVMNTIKQLENKVKIKETHSFITLAYREKLRAILFHQNLQQYPIEIPGFFTFSLDYSNFEFHTQMKVDSSRNYSIILDAYRGISEKIALGICFYVIQSRNVDKEFNGSLLLITRRSINLDEYFEITDFFTFLMQARIKYEYKKALKNAEWKKVVEQITHSKYNQRAVINDNAEDFYAILQDRNLDDLVTLFEVNEQLRRSIDRIDDFFFALNKVEYSKENIKNIKQPRIEQLLNIETVSLGDILKEQITMLQNSLKLVPFKDTKIRNNVKLFLLKFKEEMYFRFLHYKLGAVKSGFKIILLDLLKNAIKEVNEDNPQLDIQVYDFNSSEIDEWLISESKFSLPNVPYVTLAFVNNKPIVRKNADGTLMRNIYDNLLGKNTDLNTSTTRQLGVKIVKQITNYDGLGKSGLKWFYTPSTECLDCVYTKILLLIPKSDFEYGI